MLPGLQLIKLVGQERAHGGTRITFLAGGRAIRALTSSLMREARLNKVSHRHLLVVPLAAIGET